MSMKEKKVAVTVRIGRVVVHGEIDVDTIKDANLCGFDREDMAQMILGDGLAGLSNYCGHMDNWEDNDS